MIVKGNHKGRFLADDVVVLKNSVKIR